MSPAWALAAIGLATGGASLWLFRRLADTEAIRQAANHVQAHLLEFWLYVDEPWLVGKTWRGLLLANARLLRLMLVPAVVLSLPMAPLFFWLESNYGHAPLAVGAPALVTIELNQGLDGISTPVLHAPEGIAVETPPVRVFSERQVCWRIRASRPMAGALQCTAAGTRVEKSVAAGPGLRYLSQRRTRPSFELIRYPTEALLPSGPLQWIEVSYPSAAISVLGLDWTWSAWFLVWIAVGALAMPARPAILFSRPSSGFRRKPAR